MFVSISLSVGTACVPWQGSGVFGVCTPIGNCPSSHVGGLYGTRRPKSCGFLGSQHIICCTKSSKPWLSHAWDGLMNTFNHLGNVMGMGNGIRYPNTNGGRNIPHYGWKIPNNDWVVPNYNGGYGPRNYPRVTEAPRKPEITPATHGAMVSSSSCTQDPKITLMAETKAQQNSIRKSEEGKLILNYVKYGM